MLPLGTISFGRRRPFVENSFIGEPNNPLTFRPLVGGVIVLHLVPPAVVIEPLAVVEGVRGAAQPLPLTHYRGPLPRIGLFQPKETMQEPGRVTDEDEQGLHREGRLASFTHHLVYPPQLCVQERLQGGDVFARKVGSIGKDALGFRACHAGGSSC